MQPTPALEQALSLGVATASALLTEETGGQLNLRSLRVCQEGDFPDVSQADNTEVVAGVALRFDGALRGTGIFTMEPEGALAWSRAVLESAGEPENDSDSAGDAVIVTFVDLARRVLSSLVGTVGKAVHGLEVEFDAASLRENSRLAIVIGTRAPSDTAVVTLGLEVEFDGAAHAAHVDLLIEPKSLAGHWVAPGSH